MSVFIPIAPPIVVPEEEKGFPPVSGGIRVLFRNTVFLAHRLSVEIKYAKIHICREKQFLRCRDKKIVKSYAVQVSFAYFKDMGEGITEAVKTIVIVTSTEKEAEEISKKLLENTFLRGILNLNTYYDKIIYWTEDNPLTGSCESEKIYKEKRIRKVKLYNIVP